MFVWGYWRSILSVHNILLVLSFGEFLGGIPGHPPLYETLAVEMVVLQQRLCWAQDKKINWNVCKLVVKRMLYLNPSVPMKISMVIVHNY